MGVNANLMNYVKHSEQEHSPRNSKFQASNIKQIVNSKHQIPNTIPKAGKNPKFQIRKSLTNLVPTRRKNVLFSRSFIGLLFGILVIGNFLLFEICYLEFPLIQLLFE